MSSALAHDATRDLYYAAGPHEKPQSRVATWVNLCGAKLEGIVTGTINLTPAPPYGGRTCPVTSGPSALRRCDRRRD